MGIYHWGILVAYLQYLHLFKYHAGADNIDNNTQGAQFDGAIKVGNFNPLSIAKEQINTSLYYYWKDTSLSLGYSLYKLINSSQQTSRYKLGFSRTLMHNDSGLLSLNLNSSINNLKGEGSQYVLSLAYNFANPSLVGNLNVGVNHDSGQNSTDSSSSNLAKNNTVTVDGSVSKNISFGALQNDHAVIGLNGNLQGKNHALGANFDYYSDPVHGYLAYGYSNGPQIERQQNIVAQFE